MRPAGDVPLRTELTLLKGENAQLRSRFKAIEDDRERLRNIVTDLRQELALYKEVKPSSGGWPPSVSSISGILKADIHLGAGVTPYEARLAHQLLKILLRRALDQIGILVKTRAVSGEVWLELSHEKKARAPTTKHWIVADEMA